MTLPYGRQTIEARDVVAVARAVADPYLTQGPRVEEFERAVADYVGTRHAVAFSSGTGALHGAASVSGLREGLRFVTTPISFVASANCARYIGIRPRFVDIRPDGNLDTTAAADLAGRFSGTVCVAVSLGGLPVDLRPLRDAGVVTVEDACHALGAVRDGRPVGRDADMTVFSFHPVKAITTGEGGMVVTDDDGYAAALRSFRSHEIRRHESQDDPLHGGWHYEVEGLGFNYRLTDLQCALGIEQLVRLDEYVAARNEIARHYRSWLEPDSRIGLPSEAPLGSIHAYHLFVVRFPEGPDRRRTVYEFLRTHGITTQLHYIPIPAHALYRRDGYQMADLPNAQAYWEEALSLPIFPTLSAPEIARVCSLILLALDLPVRWWAT